MNRPLLLIAAPVALCLYAAAALVSGIVDPFDWPVYLRALAVVLWFAVMVALSLIADAVRDQQGGASEQDQEHLHRGLSK